MKSYTEEIIAIPAIDGYPLQSIVYRPVEDSIGIVLICPGLGIPKEFYSDYCAFVAINGYDTIVFDYRGIGKEQVSNQYDISLRNWAQLDIPGVLDWISKNNSRKNIVFIGHSIAGQMAGLIPNYQLIDQFIFISSTGGYWTLFDFPLNLFTIFMFWIHIPITARLFGYLPPSLTYRGVRISKGVALEWAKISRQKNYLSAYFGKTISNEYYRQIDKRIDWVTFEDDAIATERAVADMMSYYPNAEIVHHRINPKELNLERIGHAGFFREKGRDLWIILIRLL